MSDSDIKDISFVQTGYSMVYDSTHNFDIKIRLPGDTKSDRKKIVEGKGNKLCFDKKGSYALKPESCYKFAQEEYSFDTT